MSDNHKTTLSQVLIFKVNGIPFLTVAEKIKQGIATTYIEESSMPNGQKHRTMTGNRLVGRVEWSEETGEVPLLVIDGKPYTWGEVGKIMMSNEGFQLRMEIFDMTDDVE